MTTAVLLGLLQGISEWLPVSSEGVVAATYSYINDAPLSEGVGYALWLHVGTVPSVLVAFRREVVGLVREVATRLRRPSPLLLYLIIATAISAVIGLPLLLALEEVSARFGAAAMGIVGAMMIVTGSLQLRRGKPGVRGRDDLTKLDGALVGLAQGVTVIPGLSRSGTTVAALLARGFDRREALFLSFMMSIPASLGASLFVGLDSEFAVSGETLVAAAVAFVAGLATIRALIAVAAKINFGVFVLIVGAAIIGGAVWDALV